MITLFLTNIRVKSCGIGEYWSTAIMKLDIKKGSYQCGIGKYRSTAIMKRGIKRGYLLSVKSKEVSLECMYSSESTA